jgi:hypothetical protein
MSAHESPDHHLQRIIDTLCNDGCKAVSGYINEMEAGHYPELMQSLSNSQKQTILAELKSIMAVYDRCGN